MKWIILAQKSSNMGFCEHGNDTSPEPFGFLYAVKRKIKEYKTVILHVILYGCETWVSKIKEGTQTEGV
jgi:hypothetical protein